MTPPNRVTSLAYDKPYRPWPVALLNTLGGSITKLGLQPVSLTEQTLIAAARKETGLHYFGDESFRVPLRKLLASIEDEAKLNTLGRLITRKRLTSTLANRLRAQELFDLHPEILEQELVAPMIIIGLPRTGTTLLHRLLSSDADNRFLTSWEGGNPAMDRRAKDGGRAKRIRFTEVAEKGLAYIAPDFFAVHPVEAHAPEEEVLLLDFAFMSTVPESTMYVPSYATWVAQQDNTPAYEYMVKMLKLLQWEKPGKRWVLKTPHHQEFLDILLDVFPDAKIIHTHRDPNKTIPSFCSMTAHGRGVFSDDVDPLAVGRDWGSKLIYQTKNTMAVRQRRGDASFIDVSYYDMITDPMKQIRRIYDFVGSPLSLDAEAAMLTWQKSNKQGKHGKHLYRLEDFGLSKESLDLALESYRERFNVRHE
jgi:hypothetical protein